MDENPATASLALLYPDDLSDCWYLQEGAFRTFWIFNKNLPLCCSPSEILSAEARYLTVKSSPGTAVWSVPAVTCLHGRFTETSRATSLEGRRQRVTFWWTPYRARRAVTQQFCRCLINTAMPAARGSNGEELLGQSHSLSAACFRDIWPQMTSFKSGYKWPLEWTKVGGWYRHGNQPPPHPPPAST